MIRAVRSAASDDGSMALAPMLTRPGVDMDMAVDQAGHQRPAVEVDHLGIAADRRVGDVADFAVLDEDM